jgi:hypothetical protein
MRGVNYDSWLTSFLDYEDEDEELTDEELEELKALQELHLIQQYEANQD